MAGLHLHISNRMEVLADALAAVVGQRLGSVFEPEIVMVQSLSMRRWLTMELATRHGVCTNVDFPFPQGFVSGLFDAVLAGALGEAGFEREIMTWRIMKRLPGLLPRPEFEPVRHYVEGDRGELKRFQLSSRIAHAFDQYFAFRPEMILEWDAGRDDDWQAVLWRELAGASQHVHQPARARQFVEALRFGELFGGKLPRRVSVFGISTLPKFYLDILEAVATATEVHFFLLEPTPEWWADIVGPRREAKMLRKSRGRTARQLHIERGNTLLASMGRVGREFLGLAGDLQPVHHDERFERPDGGSMLARIQTDLFDLHEPEPDDERIRIGADDVSMQVHSCHSPMREMEVLHDQLLSLFQSDPTLTPRDIVVMLPDVAEYAPFIEAVFDTAENEEVRIPFTIADRGVRAASGAVDAFLRIIELVGSRFGSSNVISVLETPPVRSRFGLAEADLETIRIWVDRTGIRWGIDAAHRGRFGVPEFWQNTWRSGLDRLLLGYALPGGGERMFGDILPYDDVEGGLAQKLGSFAEFAGRLFDTANRLEAPRMLDQWQETLLRIVDDFFDDSDEVGRELIPLRRVIEGLGETARVSGFDETVGFDVLREHLTSAIEGVESGTGFLAGGVTFCALKPMRSIPFKVICLAGMDDRSYPRHSTAPGFDLIARDPKPGDRSMREDDRYLFLEAILSARDVFLVTYCGQSMRDNSPLPPSVLVSELVEYLARRFVAPADEEMESFVVRKHRLQAFSAAYFDGSPRLFSYSAENCRAANVARYERGAAAPFIAKPIAEPEDEWRTVDIGSLLRFFRNPAKTFIIDRLGLRLPQEAIVLDEREPFTIDSLARYGLEQRLLGMAREGAGPATALPLARAMGELPPGHGGEQDFRRLCEKAENVAQLAARQKTGAPAPPVAVNLDIDEWRLTGTIDGITERALLRIRCAKLNAHDLLGIWIPHLILNCSTPCDAMLVGEDGARRFGPAADARGQIAGLLSLYGKGLREPLRFFPRSSHAFAAVKTNPSAKRDPQDAAEKEWDAERFPEHGDPYFDLAFRGVSELFDAEFERVALDVFRPLLDAMQEVEP